MDSKHRLAALYANTTNWASDLLASGPEGAYYGYDVLLVPHDKR